MDIKSLFGETLETAAKALNLHSQRHGMIVSNLSNADTPGYKAFDLMVEESIIKQSGSESQVIMKRTHPGHLPSARTKGPGITPKIIRLPEQNNLRGDGNTPVEMALRQGTCAQPLDQNTPSEQASFGQWLKKSIEALNQMQQDGDSAAMKLVSGESKDIHGTMIAMQKASISMSLMMEVRNKIISAYDEIKRMQF